MYSALELKSKHHMPPPLLLLLLLLLQGWSCRPCWPWCTG
jgi:hypothetical protein